MRAVAIAVALLFNPVFADPSHANASNPSPQSLAGHWEGIASKDGKTFRLALDFAPEVDSSVAYVDFADLALYATPFAFQPCSQSAIADVSCLERHPPGAPATTFAGDVKGSIYEGTFDGATATGAHFRLERKSLVASILRQEDVSFRNGDVMLAGTIIFPLGNDRFSAVVVTHGGDPDTRSSAGYRGNAVMLARHGLAVLIYDKRGVGKSTGDWTTSGLDDLAGDALAGVELLRTRPEIRSDCIGVAGHSQGGWIAPLAATLSRDVAFVIATSASSLGPMAQSLYHNANEMREAGFAEGAIKKAQDLRRRMYGRARVGSVDDQFLKDLEAASKEPWFVASKLSYPFPPTLAPGERRLLLFEPLPVWRQVRVPVLAVWGSADINLPAQQSHDEIAAALDAGGNMHKILLVLQGMSHGLYQVRPKSAPWDFPRVDLAYEATVADWINRTAALLERQC